MEKYPDQVGFLVLTEEGAVLESGGELENQEGLAAILTDLMTLSNRIDPVAFSANDQIKKVSINYEDHSLILCLSNKKIYVVKRTLTDADTNTVNA